jgi:hypothetical protein
MSTQTAVYRNELRTERPYRDVVVEAMQSTEV